MAFRPDGDPSGPADGYPGSIFGIGHDWQKYVSEINIPVPVISPGKNVGDLNTAGTLQPFRDVRAGIGSLHVLQEIPRVGMEYLPAQGSQTSPKLYLSWGAHFQEEEQHVASHMWCDTNLTNSRGAWWVGGYSLYSVNDYLFEIPQGWASANTPGMRLATGRFRDGGWGGQGPALFAIGPWNHGNPPPNDAILDAVPLVLYSSTATDEPPYHTMTAYHHSDEWSGGAWITAGSKAAVVFVGTKGTGNCWYGLPDGTVWPDEPPYPDDPEGVRGWWSTGFVGQMLFYDPDDLATVASGAMQPYEPQPYATLNLDSHLYAVTSTQQKYHVVAASFDRDRGHLYVFEPRADGDKCLVHCWAVQSDVAQPDAMIRRQGETAWTGNGVYNTTGRDQARWKRAAASAPAVYYLRAQNDGNMADRLRVTGTPGDDDWGVTYWRGQSNITAQVTGSGGVTWQLSPREAARLRLKVRPRPGAAEGTRKVVLVTARSMAVRTNRDVVKAVTRAFPAASAAHLTNLAAVPSPVGAEIVCSLSAPMALEARILNIAGRTVKSLCRAKDCEAGTNTLLWNAQSDNGLPVPNGTYLVEVMAKAGDGSQARGLAQVRVNR